MSEASAGLPELPPAATRPTSPLLRTALLVLPLLVVGVALAWWQFSDWTPTPTLFRQAREALSQQQFERAEQLGRRLMGRPERRVEGLIVVAESLRNRGQHDAALQLLKEVSARDEKSLFVTSRLMMAQIEADERHQPAAAEAPLREALEVDPYSMECQERLVYLLGLGSRTWEAIPHRLMLIQQESFPQHHLSLLSLGNTAAENPEIITALARTAPDDPLVTCGRARIAQRDGSLEQAEKLYNVARQTAPTLWGAQAWYAEVLLSRQKLERLPAWLAELPVGADDFPDIWLVKGLWAEALGDQRGAARCYWECLERDPTHQVASHKLTRMLSALGETRSAEIFREHARRLNELITAAKTVEISGSNVAKKKAAQIAQQLGLKWEAWAWRDVLRRTDPRSRLKPEPAPSIELTRMDPAASPTRKVDLSQWPLPSWPAVSGPSSPQSTPLVASDSPIRFVEQAREVGIDFQYQNASRPETSNEYMYEFSGGGVAVLDYDNDGWPDLHLTQGASVPPYQPQDKYLDCLYRNELGQRFQEMAAAARVVEPGFSQGCTVGDFNSDGFADLYIANIGKNRFFRNNGDGTFTDVTNETGTGSDRWSTSCVLADFTGDGLADLYVTNYLTGANLFTSPCRMPDGSTRLCTPHEFPAAHDQFYVNRGDGRFADQSAAAGIEVPEGKGLGVVAADFDRSHHLSLFIANDAVPNFFFANQTTGPGAPARFEEQAFLTGLAVDGDGQPQACMGIAAGDPNGDGRLDLLVTNFRNESNTLYLQQADGSFIDGTRDSGLREPSFPMLGFGTQFIDADLDGWEDLIVTNGHVGNLQHHGVPYEMETQFFRNVGGGKFVEVPAKTLGPFFQGKYLGRGMARLDWNRDGLEDIVITDLRSPVMLLTNQTRPIGRSLTLHLQATTSARDAIGSTLTLTSGDRQIVRQLTAGDGYQASNQRSITLGLTNSTMPTDATVQWPNGRQQTFAVPSGTSFGLLIEGRDAIVRLEKNETSAITP